MGYNSAKKKMKKLLLLTIFLCTTSFAQECFAQSDDPYYNIGYSVGSAIKKNTDENREKNKAYEEEISSTKREIEAERRKLEELDRLINMSKERVAYNKETRVLTRGEKLRFYEIDAVPDNVFVTLTIVEPDYLMFALRIKDPSSTKHYLSCDATIQYHTFYGDEVISKKKIDLEVNHINTYDLKELFDLSEDAIDERTLKITFTGMKVTIKS